MRLRCDGCRPFEIVDGAQETGYIITERTQAGIAGIAQPPSQPKVVGLVVMVETQFLSRPRRSSADFTACRMTRHDRVVLLTCNLVTVQGRATATRGD